MENKFEHIVEGTDLGTWEWNVQTGATKFNERWAEIIGYTLAELGEISISTWMKYAHPEDLKGSNLALEAHFNGQNNIYEFESRMRHKNGHWVWVLDKGKVFSWTEDGKPEWMAGSHQEITDKKKEQLALIKHRELLDNTTSAALIGVWEVVLADNSTYWGDMTRKIHEVPSEYVPTLEGSINFYPAGPDRDKILEGFTRAVEKNIPYDVELQILTYTDKLKWVRTIGIPTFEGGKCIKVFGLFQDIENFKQIQEENESLISTMRDQNNRLKNFAHIVSHNLRSHSNNFSMLTSMLHQDIDDDRRQKLNEMLLSASDKLKETILHLDEVVDINLHLNDNFTSLHLNDFINSSINNLTVLADSQHVKIEMNLGKAYQVYGVPAYLESITLNLISNAIKYADPGKESSYLNITAEESGSDVLLKFEDNGLGINLKKEGDNIFGMYKTFHKNKDARGIGLFISKNQIEAMGGKISVDSELGVGSTFTVQLKGVID